MPSPDPVVAERQMYLNLLGINDDPNLTTAQLRALTGGAASVKLAADVGTDYVTQAELAPQLNLKAPLIDPVFQGNVQGITKAAVGLGNVDNTSDVNKPVSTAQNNAINAATAAITKASLGLGNVDNTSDVNKPISTAVAAALAGKLTSTNGIIKGTDGKTYVLISCVVRNTGSGWDYINDSGHRPTNVGALVQSTTDITIPYNVGGSAFTGSKVSSLIVGVDETFAQQGVRVGPSVGLGSTVIEMYTDPSDRISDYLEYNGTTWTSQNGLMTPSYNGAGVLTVTHESMATDRTSGLQVSPRGTAMAEPGAYTATSFTVAFYTGAFGSLTATGAASGAQHRVYCTRFGNRASVPKTNPANLVSAFGNFWVIGLIEV